MSKSPALRPPISDLRSPASVYPSDQIAFGPDNVQDAPRCAGGYQPAPPGLQPHFKKVPAQFKRVWSHHLTP